LRLFYGQRAASILNKRRKTLRQEHAGLRALLRKSGQIRTTEVSEKIASLRFLRRQALMDCIQVCETLSQRVYVLNLMGYAKAHMAQSRLFAVCQEVAQTLGRLDAAQSVNNNTARSRSAHL
jgi:hypothetical protein